MLLLVISLHHGIEKRLDIKTKTIHPYSHGSLKQKDTLEPYMKLLQNSLMVENKCGCIIYKLLFYAYFSFAPIALNGLCQIQLTYHGLPKVLLEKETNPEEGYIWIL